MPAAHLRGRLSLRLAFSLSTAIASGVAAPALAQVAPPPFRHFDGNGVDVVRGDYLLTLREGSIGAGAGELALIRQIGSAANGESQWDGLSLQVTRPWINGPATVSVYRGNRTETFTASGGGYVSNLAMGAQLTGGGSSFTLTERDGTTISFADPTGNPNVGATNFCKDSTQISCRLVPTQIDSPDGASVAMQWETVEQCASEFNMDGSLDCQYWWRLGSVANDDGYRIAFTYLDNSSSGQPPTNSYRRSGASFINDKVGGTQGSVSYSYPSNFVTLITDQSGQTWHVTPGSIRRPGAASDSISVAASGIGQGLVVTANGVTTNYARTVSGTTATMTVNNGLGVKTIVSNMTIGRPTAITDETGRTTQYSYDAAGRLTRVTNPDGDYVEYTLDARGNATQTAAVPKPGSGETTLITGASYPATCSTPHCNQPNSTTDALGRVTDYAYDGVTGLPLSVTAPAPAPGVARPQTRFSYTSVNGIARLQSTSACRAGATCAGTADEVKTSYAYDTNGNVVAVTSGDGANQVVATTALSWNPRGDPIAIDGPLPGTADTANFQFDAGRRLVTAATPDPDGGGPLRRRATRYQYNADGTVASVATGHVDADVVSNFVTVTATASAYDANARKIRDSLIGSDGGTHAITHYGYDTRGRPLCTALRMDPAQWNGQTDACTPQTTGAFGPDRIARTEYDAAGRVTRRWSAWGTADQSADVTLAYTQNGQVASLLDAENNLTSYIYDGHDRLFQTRYPVTATGTATSSVADFEQFAYNAVGNVVSRRLRDGQWLHYNYDALDRLIYETNPKTNVAEVDVAHQYDLLGRLTYINDGNGWFHSFGYDGLGRVVAQGSNVASNTMQYDAAGRLTRHTWADGLFVTYEYLTTGEMAAVRENGSTLLASFGYDNAGRRTSLSRGNGTSTGYGYDAASRLANLNHDLAGTGQDVGYTLTYNPAGQIHSRTTSNAAYVWAGHYNVDRDYTTNGLNQLTAAGATGLGYDGRGNLNQSGADTYTYNTRNHLIWSSGGSFTYRNPLGLLGQEDSANHDYVGGRRVLELSGGILRRYVWGPGEDEPLVWYEGSGTGDKRWLAADERGSIVSVSNASGASIAVNTYDEYGIPGPNNLGRFQYTGQSWIASLGMYDYKARMYSPTLGRFMQTDPIGYGDGPNWYNYVGSDPINAVDPTGLACKIVGSVQPISGESIVNAKMVCDGGGALPRGRVVGPANDVPVGGDVNQEEIASNEYEGCTFGNEPTTGRPNKYYPQGRVNSGRPGDFSKALGELDQIARLNGVPQLGSVPGFTGSIGHISPTPVPVGDGWLGWTNPKSNYTNFTHPSGLAFRVNPMTTEVRVEVPSGFKLPSGEIYQGRGPEVCHYPRG